MTTTTSAIEKYWQDDFSPLQFAGKAIRRELREDEIGGDLHRMILENGSSSHLYFSCDKSFQYERTIPLPPRLAAEAKNVSKSLLMGLLQDASLAWMSVDHKLFLWPIEEDEHFLELEITNKQNIVCVGIAKPKNGTFEFY
jgi:Nup133 N terminal like